MYLDGKWERFEMTVTQKKGTQRLKAELKNVAEFDERVVRYMKK